jgi:outer membrane biogenesis lipoprotein LolB
MGSLRYWILGLPLDGEDFQLDQDGRVGYIQNRPWQVEYQRYRRVGQYELPQKLQLRGPEIKIKLLIRDWRVM